MHTQCWRKTYKSIKKNDWIKPNVGLSLVQNKRYICMNINLSTKNQESTLSLITSCRSRCRLSHCLPTERLSEMSPICFYSSAYLVLFESTWEEIYPISNERQENMKNLVEWSGWVVKKFYYFVPFKSLRKQLSLLNTNNPYVFIENCISPRGPKQCRSWR